MTDTSSSGLQSTRSCSVGALGQVCRGYVDQCLLIVETLPDQVFRHRDGNAASIGSHMRHIIDRMTCVLNGTSAGSIDYDLRERDAELERSRQKSAFVLAEVGARFEALEAQNGIRLQVTESVHEDQLPVTAVSTLERELMSLISHTIHHLAIIVLLARENGVRLNSTFGKAPSTLIHERRQSRPARAV